MLKIRLSDRTTKMYATYDELFSDPEIEFNIETNLGKFNSWTELSDKTTNII